VPALHCKDCVAEGFEWIDGSDADRSIVAWLRKGSAGDAPVAVICNFTPIPREAVVVGLPETGTWHEIFNSDAEAYGGAGAGNLGAVEANGPDAHGQAQSARVTLPALSTVMLCPSRPSD
jgi:1,4-alpha-glucan branching enzyme